MKVNYTQFPVTLQGQICVKGNIIHRKCILAIILQHKNISDTKRFICSVQLISSTEYSVRDFS